MAIARRPQPDVETTLVVPCFNEAERLLPEEFLSFVKENPGYSVLFVDDGSSDGTLHLLTNLEAHACDRFSVLRLADNRGKGEAVRAGLLRAIEREAGFVGYWDADLATPLDEVPRLRRVLDRIPNCDAAFGSRVKLLGRAITRRALRHYMGRVFATLASLGLGLPIYDTQCGAKLFRVTPELRELLHEPFVSRWIFDVELIARWIRMRRGTGRAELRDAICEVPVRTWRDVGGSKLRALDVLRILVDLIRIGRP